jgi:outer membrane protein assembly factor BamA
VVGVSVTVAVDEGAEFKLGKARFVTEDGSPIAAKQLRELDKAANLHEDALVNFDDINRGLERVSDLYKGNGYLNVAVKPEREIKDEDKLLNLTVKIVPGAQYNYGKLAIRGLDILSEPVIRKMWGEREGKPYDPKFADSFLNNIRDQRMFDNLGKTEAIPEIHEDTKVVDITLDFKGARKPRRDPLEGMKLPQ